jgi:hypothetical protein
LRAFQAIGYVTYGLSSAILIPSDGCSLLLNITTRRPESDLSCILAEGDHTYIVCESAVAYWAAKAAKLIDLERALSSISTLEFQRHSSVEDTVLVRILNGALISPELPRKFYKYVGRQLP